MRKSDLSVILPGSGSPVQLHLRLSSDRRVLEAWGDTQAVDETRQALNWLCQWLPGKAMSEAFETVAEAYIKAFPELPWTSSQLPQELVRQALYQSHPHVQVNKADPIVCRCHSVRESQLKQALLDHPASNVQGLGLLTKAGSGCGSCRPQLQALVERMRPAGRRWNGFSNAEWTLKVQDSLALWQERTVLSWAKSKVFSVASFQSGSVTVRVDGGLTADQEWELTQALSDYWAEGFPVALALFLDFELA